MRIDVLSPDGFSIHPTKTYASYVGASFAFYEWRKRYKAQGYYSSTNYGRIDLIDLPNYCELVKVTEETDTEENTIKTPF